MPDISFEADATLDELAGVGRNRRFDEVIDEGDNENIEVICRRGGEEIPYDQEAKRYDNYEKAPILQAHRSRLSAHPLPFRY